MCLGGLCTCVRGGGCPCLKFGLTLQLKQQMTSIWGRVDEKSCV